MCIHGDTACECLGAGVSSLPGNASSSEDEPMEEEESMSFTRWGEPTGAERCDFEVRANLKYIRQFVQISTARNILVIKIAEWHTR